MKQKILVSCLLLSFVCKADGIPHFDKILKENEIERSTLSVETESAPRPGGSYYSQALYINHPREILFISGQLPIDPDTDAVIANPVLATQRCMLNIQALLTNAGMDFSHLKKVIIAITNMADVLTICDTYASYLSAPYPTLSVIGVASLPLGSVVGIEAMAVN